MVGSTDKKDWWDRFDIVAKGIIALFVSGGLTYYGMVIDGRRADAENEDRQARTLVQLVSAREQAATDLRARMFDTLLQNYFSKEDPLSRIVALELIGLNFKNTIQIKPLFEQLNRQFIEIETDEARRGIQMLRRAAKRLIKDQLIQIGLAEEGMVTRETLPVGGELPGLISGVRMLVHSLDEDGIRILVERDDVQSSFHVTYYDMPLVDFSVDDDSGLKYAVVLEEARPGVQEADIAIAVLPQESFSAQNTYRFDELLSRFILPIDKE